MNEKLHMKNKKGKMQLNNLEMSEDIPFKIVKNNK